MSQYCWVWCKVMYIKNARGIIPSGMVFEIDKTVFFDRKSNLIITKPYYEAFVSRAIEYFSQV